MTTLKADGLTKSFRHRKVVDGVEIEVSKSEIVGLLGPNGAGKTTTFYMTVGLTRPDTGRVFLNGTDVTDLPMFKRARMGLGYLPQEQSVFRKLTVLENIIIVLERTHMPRREMLARADAVLSEMNIAHLKTQYARTLSGGERRRLEIARSLAVSPSFILLDEPFSGIDPIAVKDLQQVIAHLKERGIGILITDHNVRETLKITDRAYIISGGKIIESGDPREIASSESARNVYLGNDFKLE